MTKADLKTGMVVTTRAGEKYLVVLKEGSVFGCDQLVNLSPTGGFVSLTDYSNDLLHLESGYTVTGKKFDIIKIEELRDPMDVKFSFTKNHRMSSVILWTRPEKKKYTYSQLKEILGEEFEIVKD